MINDILRGSRSGDCCNVNSRHDDVLREQDSHVVNVGGQTGSEAGRVTDSRTCSGGDSRDEERRMQLHVHLSLLQSISAAAAAAAAVNHAHKRFLPSYSSISPMNHKSGNVIFL